MNEEKVFRYLKFRSRRGMVRGTTICKHLGLPFHLLGELDDHGGVGSFGPAGPDPKRRQLWTRYAKQNDYMAGSRFFFHYDGRYHCHQDRNLRKGKWPPRMVRLFCGTDLMAVL